MASSCNSPIGGSKLSTSTSFRICTGKRTQGTLTLHAMSPRLVPTAKWRRLLITRSHQETSLPNVLLSFSSFKTSICKESRAWPDLLQRWRLSSPHDSLPATRRNLACSWQVPCNVPWHAFAGSGLQGGTSPLPFEAFEPEPICREIVVTMVQKRGCWCANLAMNGF